MCHTMYVFFSHIYVFVCSSRQMAPWRDKCGMKNMFNDGKDLSHDPRVCGAKGSFEGKGLVDHLSKEGMTCPAHYGTLRYLLGLYGDMWNGVGHKYLHNVNDSKYKKAEKAEAQQVRQLIDQKKRQRKKNEILSAK